MPELFGWHEDPREVEAVMATLPYPLFASAASQDVLDDAPRSVWFWDAEEFLFGQTLPAHNQGIGDCVSHGWGRGAQDLHFSQIMAERLAGKVGQRAYQVATEGVYALSRVEIGGRRLGRGDGSVGAWAANAVAEYGVLARKNYSSEGFDLSKYDANRAKDWGYAGLPDNLEDDAKLFPVKNVSLVTDVDEARVSLQNRYPIPVCSGQGFTRTRERGTGICKPSGSWAHCMLLRGFLILKGGKWVFPMQQSWGNDPTGPDEVELEDGRVIRLPQGVFNVEAEVIGKMLRNWKDSFAMSGGTLFTRDTRPNHSLAS